MHRVFVYGTLKRGQRNSQGRPHERSECCGSYLQSADFVGTFSTEAFFSMYAFEDYPAVCEQGRHAIHGEIYQVSDIQLDLLDELEWYPDFYQRIVIATGYGDAWMYVVKAELCHRRKLLVGRWP